MSIDSLLIRRYLVFGSALVYWIGVIMHAYQLRKRIGRSPNIKPRGVKERLLWIGWFFVIAGWIAQPLIISRSTDVKFLAFLIPFSSNLWALPGMVMLLIGHSGTLWCYSSLGDSWRLGIDRNEKTVLVKNGPYQWVRHPIYLFQMILLFGAFLLLPTPFSLILLFIHYACVLIKAGDEETYLMQAHALEYTEYRSRTGRFLPKWKDR